MTTSTLLAPPRPLSSESITDPHVVSWQSPHVSVVSPDRERHSIHSYYVTCPESPDGRHVVFYTSSTSNGENGEIWIRERSTGKETLLVQDITTEDAHRAACQQWMAGGKIVAFHDCRNGRWIVAAVDISTGQERILAEDRQVGFGNAAGVWLPIYGCHWKVGTHRDLELVNVETGEILTALTVEEIVKAYKADIESMVGEGEVSVFFPVMSPDGQKVMFKVSRGSGGDDFRSPGASRREGKFVYDLKAARFIRLFRHWGHPSWTPDSRGIFEAHNILSDIYTGETRHFATGSPSDHPSVSPGSQIFVTDGALTKLFGGNPGEWGIVIGSLTADEYATIHRFDHSKGATSWRLVHPHPSFSSDGKRIYFNVSDGRWSRLHVAEKITIQSKKSQ